jgi:hypothetical protein
MVLYQGMIDSLGSGTRRLSLTLFSFGLDALVFEALQLLRLATLELLQFGNIFTLTGYEITRTFAQQLLLFTKTHQLGKNLVLSLKQLLLLVTKRGLGLQQSTPFRISKRFVRHLALGASTSANATGTTPGTIRTDTDVSKAGAAKTRHKGLETLVVD